MWDSIKTTNICIIGGPESGGGRGKGGEIRTEKIFEGTLAEILPNLTISRNPQILKAQ